MDRSGKVKKPLSCAECRRLKIKCTLRFPCAACVKRGLESICPDGVLVNGSRRTKILSSTEELHERIVALEDALGLVTTNHPLLLSPLYPKPHVIRRSSTATAEPSSSYEQPSTLSENMGGCVGKHEDSHCRQPSGENCLSTFSHLVVGEDPQITRYFGAASSVFLTKRSLYTPEETHSPAPLSPLDFPGLFAHEVNDVQGRITTIMERHLPPEPVARELAHIYFEVFGLYTEMVQRSTWERDFLAPVYGGSARPPCQKVAMVLFICALGCLMDLARPPHDPTAMEYFSAARACLSLDPTHSVTYVQCIYLYGLFLQNGGRDTSGGDRFWPLLRLGMAVVEALGLHRDGTNWNLGEEEAEKRRIVFWEIHNHDVLTSIALGRGQCISDRSIDAKIPQMITGSGGEYNTHGYALTRIWSKINDFQIRIEPTSYQEILDVDQQLSQFQANLPATLAQTGPPSLLELTDPARKRMAYQRNMLQLFLAEARLGLHRGWFVRVLQEFPSEPLDSPQRHSFLGCLEACRVVIALIRNLLAIRGPIAERRWHYYHHLFSACVCLAACGIRAPGSSVAKAVLCELDLGIDLFRASNRPELATMERLKQQASDAISAGAHPNTLDTEDLDLIGARKQLLSAQRTQAEHSGQHGQGHFPMSSMAPQLDHSQSHGHSHGHVQPYPTDGYLLFHQNDHQTVQPVGMGTNTFSQLQDLPGVGFLPPTGIGLNTESVNSDINEFDMDAFLREMGLA